MTANTLLINISAGEPKLSRAFVIQAKIGLYSVNGSSLSLLNSGTVTWGATAANVTNTALFYGQRFLTIHSSNWSAQPTLSRTNYFVGAVANTHTSGAGGDVPGFATLGFRILNSGTINSGTVGISQTAGSTSQGYYPWIGVSGATRAYTQGLPTNIQLSQLVKTGAYYGLIPYLQINNIASNF
jgi:hypothetical protein